VLVKGKYKFSCQGRQMNRRQLLIAASLLPFSKLALASEFSDFMAEQQQGAKGLTTEFEEYQKAYLKEFSSYKKAIEKEWDDARTSSPYTWTTYSNNKKSRTTIDYRSNTVQVEIRADEKPTRELINKLVVEAVNKPVGAAVNEDQLLSKLIDKPLPVTDTLMSGIAIVKEKLLQLVNKVKVIADQDSKGQYVSIVVPLPESSKNTRSNQFLPSVKKYSKEFDIDRALVFAIIQTESAFNPMAQSHIPAFGLMQIVPRSAGVDVQQLLFKKRQAPSSRLLFNPDTNIRYGTAYLHILKYKYLKSITNIESREYCCIAAYNTGAGNVAKAFTGKTNVKAAAVIINKMTPKEVYTFLIRNLKHKEARDYVQRVNSAKEKYLA